MVSRYKKPAHPKGMRRFFICYTQAMEWIFGISGIVAGFVVGVVVGRRASPAAPLFAEADTEEDERTLAAREAIKGRTERRFARIMEAAQKQGRITNDGVEELFCISDRTASTYLRQLTERGELNRQGVGRGTFYIPIDGG